MGGCLSGKSSVQRRHSKIETMFSTWNNIGYFDSASLISELSSIRSALYLVTQHNYKQNWSKILESIEDSPDNLKSEGIKISVRKGIADSDMHNFYGKMFDLTNHSYKHELKLVFSIEVPEEILIFPTFSENVTLIKAVNTLYINEEGAKALKRILWVLSNLHPEINYSPQIVNIISLLLVYNTEEECYTIIKKLINSSAHEKNIILKHITFNVKELRQVVGIIMKVLGKKCEELIEYLDSKKISLKTHIAKIFSSFGIGYFSFALLMRMLGCFIIEGNKVFIKIIISMFVLYCEKISTERFEDFDEYLKKCFYSQNSIDLIMKKAFKVKLSRFDFEGSIVDLNLKQPIYLYRPYIEKPFGLFKESSLQLLWGNFPQLYRVHRPKLVYSSESQGISLRTLLRNARDFESKTPMLLAIKSEQKNVYGIFLDCAIRESNEYVGNSESFLFQLEPEFVIFNSSGKNSNYAWSNGEMVAFGAGGHGPALSIDKYIGTCQSYVSDTFDNPVFEGGYFSILACEVIALIL